NRYKGGAPVSQEQIENDDRQQQTDQNCITHRIDRSPDQQRLIVKRGNDNVLWQLRLHRRQFGLDSVNDAQRIGVRLADDVQQHGGLWAVFVSLRVLSISGHQRVLRFYSAADGSYVGNCYRSIVHRGNHYRVQILRTFRLAAYQGHFQVVILIDQTGRD